MSDKKKCCNCNNLENKVKSYPGVATDVADNEQVSAAEVKQDTDLLNNNPRNNGDPI